MILPLLDPVVGLTVDPFTVIVTPAHGSGGVVPPPPLLQAYTRIVTDRSTILTERKDNVCFTFLF